MIGCWSLSLSWHRTIIHVDRHAGQRGTSATLREGWQQVRDIDVVGLRGLCNRYGAFPRNFLIACRVFVAVLSWGCALPCVCRPAVSLDYACFGSCKVLNSKERSSCCLLYERTHRFYPTVRRSWLGGSTCCLPRYQCHKLTGRFSHVYLCFFVGVIPLSVVPACMFVSFCLAVCRQIVPTHSIAIIVVVGEGRPSVIGQRARGSSFDVVFG